MVLFTRLIADLLVRSPAGFYINLANAMAKFRRLRQLFIQVSKLMFTCSLEYYLCGPPTGRMGILSISLICLS